MAGRERTWYKIKHIFSRICCVQAKQTEAIDTGHGDGDYDDDSLDLEEGVKQYRLEAARKVRANTNRALYNPCALKHHRISHAFFVLL